MQTTTKPSISKLCADHLRNFAQENGVKLGASHAHELVAAYFGYKSRAALLADTLCPIDNLGQEHIFVLPEPALIEPRRQCLQDLPADLPDNYLLIERLVHFLKSEKLLPREFFGSFSHLSEELSRLYLQQYGDRMLPPSFSLFEKASSIFGRPLYEFNPKIETTNNIVILTVSNRYYGSADVNFYPIDVVVTIKLQRVAGHVGYILQGISGERASPDDWENPELHYSIN